MFVHALTAITTALEVERYAAKISFEEDKIIAIHSFTPKAMMTMKIDDNNMKQTIILIKYYFDCLNFLKIIFCTTPDSRSSTGCGGGSFFALK